MKSTRQNIILQIIAEQEIETQNQLMDVLAQRGVPSTQATLSRDIKELHLTKTLAPSGKYRYAAPAADEFPGYDERLKKIFRECVTSYAEAQNIIVIKTLPGLAYGARRVLANLLTSTEPTKMEGLPNVYCGFAAVALAVFFLCCKKVRLREKLLSVGLLAFFLLSFLFRTLDYYWHGGHFPNMLPYRFSFLFSFVLIVMAYRAWTLLDCFRKRYLFVILPVCLGIILCGLGLEGSLRRMLLSALALAIVCLALVLYRPERRRQLLSMALLFAVIGAEMVCSIAMGVAKVSLTSRSSYPRESEDVQAVLQAVPEGSGRVEATSYQTLNDAALNGYRGISVFTSSANVRFNRFSRSLGLASWPASNRYLYYESSPFTNLMCGLEYLIDRDGQQRDTSYTTVAAQSGNVLLLRSRAYLGLGFVADPALGSFVAEQNIYNPIKEQEEMFRMATGLDDALYTHLKYDTLEAPEACDLRASGTSGTQYSYSTQDADGQSELSISYVVPQDGLLVATTKSSGNYDLTVYRNGERLFTRNIKVRCLFSLGCFNAGDTVTLTYPVAEGKDGTISLDVAEQNDAVFDAGLSRLSRSVWNVTEDTDTNLSGTVDAAEDGLFYTSIPYENGWRAYVDGVEIPLAQTVAIGDGANDLPMIKAAGLGIAYHAKPKVNEKAEVTIRHADLMGVFCILSGSLNQK